MTAGKSPSGLPRKRIIGPMWGPAEADVYRRVGSQHGGLLRVRRSLLIPAGVVAVIAVVVAIAGAGDAAWGIVGVLLVPLLLILVVLQVIVMLTRPKKTPDRPEPQ